MNPDSTTQAATPQEVTESLRRMTKVVNNLLARADSIPFREPVDWKGLELYDYPKVIKKMMDLGTIKKKLEKGKYMDAGECAGDIRLVWTNCMTYNADGSDFYLLAESFSKRFEERFQKIIDEFGEDVVYGNAGGSALRSQSHSKKSRANSFTSRATTPTGSLLEKTGSSIAASQFKNLEHTSEKSQLGIVPLDVRTRFAARLQRLSGMELGHVLKVIDMKCPEALEDPPEDCLPSDATKVPKQHNYGWDEFDGGCQIEIDIDAIPPVVFHELDTYVREKVKGRGRGAWTDDLSEDTASEFGGSRQGKKRKVKSIKFATTT
ncbi:hypothetical protein ACHAW6_003721 [Cyclotella cf. meneghiniana]